MRKIFNLKYLYVSVILIFCFGCSERNATMEELLNHEKSSYEGELTSINCPLGFVEVQSLKGYTSQNFCVAKYEMKNKNGHDEAISEQRGIPWVEINRDDAITQCENIGSGYDLITNSEWQTVARNIEQVASNWYENRIGSKGGLNRGYSFQKGVSSRGLLPLEASDDDNGCYGTEGYCRGDTWHINRRTHFLSNNRILWVLWDIAGNAWEWVKDDNDSSKGDDDLYISQVINESIKDLFGPKETIASLMPPF